MLFRKGYCVVGWLQKKGIGITKVGRWGCDGNEREEHSKMETLKKEKKTNLKKGINEK